MSFLLEKMSAQLLVPLNDLEYLVRSSPYRYKVYKIAKRTPGKTRIIAQPAKEVKTLQHWVMRNVLNTFPVHAAATAYRKGRNIADNAQPHVAKRYMLKMDFSDFFPSITSSDFVQFMKTNSLAVWQEEEDIEYLCRILFWRKKRRKSLVLSIGAPSSPILSNILLYDFDVRMSELCVRHDVSYTRYADDLTFSTNKPNTLKKIEKGVLGVCAKLRSPRLKINIEKTVHVSTANSRRVTGLVLSNQGSVSLGREKKRSIRAAVHHYKQGKLNEGEIASLSGMLSFVYSVEPSFLQTLASRYGGTLINSLRFGRDK
jgi:RNA-directed DNA polymerase